MNILWLFDQPLNPEAGGTERVSSLIMEGLREHGFNCYGHLVIKDDSNICYYNNRAIKDLYGYLTVNDINVVINQKAQDAEFLKHFLQIGGMRWKNNGGKIISCLHFNPKPIQEYYDIKTLLQPSLLKLFLLLRAKIFSHQREMLQLQQVAIKYNYIGQYSNIFVLLTETHRMFMENILQSKYTGKLKVIPNPLTFQETLHYSDLSPKENIAIYVGRMDEYYKRISIILQAWHYLVRTEKDFDWKLLLIGNGPDIEKYKQYCQKHRLNNVSFEGRQNPGCYYKKAKLFLMTSISEGLPMTILESFQNGVVPVVMDACPVFSEIVADGVNGVICHDSSVKKYALSIKRAMNLDLYAMGMQAIQSAKNYSMNTIIDSWILEIKSL